MVLVVGKAAEGERAVSVSGDGGIRHQGHQAGDRVAAGEVADRSQAAVATASHRDDGRVTVMPPARPSVPEFSTILIAPVVPSAVACCMTKMPLEMRVPPVKVLAPVKMVREPGRLIYDEADQACGAVVGKAGVDGQCGGGRVVGEENRAHGIRHRASSGKGAACGTEGEIARSIDQLYTTRDPESQRLPGSRLHHAVGGEVGHRQRVEVRGRDASRRVSCSELPVRPRLVVAERA